MVYGCRFNNAKTEQHSSTSSLDPKASPTSCTRPSPLPFLVTQNEKNRSSRQALCLKQGPANIPAGVRTDFVFQATFGLCLLVAALPPHLSKHVNLSWLKGQTRKQNTRFETQAVACQCLA